MELKRKNKLKGLIKSHGQVIMFWWKVGKGGRGSSGGKCVSLLCEICMLMPNKAKRNNSTIVMSINHFVAQDYE